MGIGGETAMWSEFVNSVNLTPRLWPRASAIAERLWSPRDVRDIQEAKHRIQEMVCRMLQRGFPVEPITGPQFCNVNWNASSTPTSTSSSSPLQRLVLQRQLGYFGLAQSFVDLFELAQRLKRLILHLTLTLYRMSVTLICDIAILTLPYNNRI